jgi:predicted Mrr-cat superfamily restriction endonuclease
MKVKVAKAFSDKFNHQMHSVGSTFEVDDDRGQDLIGRGLVIALENPKPETKVRKLESAEKPEEKSEKPKKRVSRKKKDE